jgi:hypothetical protein
VGFNGKAAPAGVAPGDRYHEWWKDRLLLLFLVDISLPTAERIRSSSRGGSEAAKIRAFSFLAVVDTTGMVPADPLAPSMQCNSGCGLFARKIGIPHEPQMGIEVALGEGVREPANTAGDAARARVHIRPFKRENVYFSSHRVHWAVTD